MSNPRKIIASFINVNSGSKKIIGEITKIRNSPILSLEVSCIIVKKILKLFLVSLQRRNFCYIIEGREGGVKGGEL